MRKLKFAVFGTGFWSYYQLSGWKELEGAEPVAFCNRTLPRAQKLADQFGVQHVYDDPAELLDRHAHELDFVDIISDVDSHALLTLKTAAKGLPVICQKPMAPNLEAARQMVEACREAGVKLYIHENFRWQKPLRQLKEVLESGKIGKPFKGRVTFTSAFPVFENQPFLAELEEFILTDIGSHILDVCRFLFGEAASLCCHTARVNLGIKGEDVANVLLRMRNGVSCFAEMSYASLLEKEAFPQTLVQVEGDQGSVVLTHDFVLKVTTREGTTVTEATPEMYSWADPAYALIHSSIVDCNRDLLQDLLGQGKAETTGEDNFETIRLLYACYESARENRVVFL
ncbi:Gfo/Idh/MocA family oxidoreductase [soil metagenome]